MVSKNAYQTTFHWTLLGPVDFLAVKSISLNFIFIPKMISESFPGNKSVFDGRDIGMEKAYKSDLIKEIEKAKIDALNKGSRKGIADEDGGRNKSIPNRKSKMNNATKSGAQSPTISESVQTFSSSNPNGDELHKRNSSYRPKLQKQESLPTQGIPSGSVNPSQSMPFGRTKLHNGKIEYPNIEGIFMNS